MPNWQWDSTSVGIILLIVLVCAKFFPGILACMTPHFFFCPHITVLIVRPFQYRLIYMDFFNESKNQIYLYLIVLILYYAEKTAAFILMTLWHQI